jgi:zinc transport system substrate-binding protein
MIKNHIRSLSIISLILLVLTFVGTSCREAGQTDDRIGVVVSIAPQADFVEAVGGEKVHVTIMVPPGADPHTYEPTPGQLVELSQARMYAEVGSGLQFELAWMGKISQQNKHLLIVDCSKGIELMAGGEDSQEGTLEGAQVGTDPHVWLSPKDAEVMLENIAAGLISIDPDNESYYAQGRDAYLTKLEALDKDIRDGLAGITNRRFIVFHPAWSYFAAEYNLEEIPIEIGNKEPSAKDIANVVEEARQYNIKVIFAEPEFNPRSAEVIAQEIDGEVVFINPLARDYINNMRAVLNDLVQAME